MRRDRLLPLSSVHGLLRHVYGLMELYGLRHGLRCLHGLSGGHLSPLFRIRMRVSRSSVRSILDRWGRLCILYWLRRLLLRYVLRHGCCRFRLENLRLSVLPVRRSCFLSRLWRLHKRFLSEKASLGGFFLHFRHFCVNVLLFFRRGECLRLPEPRQCLGIAFAGNRLIRLFQQFFHFLPFFPDLLRFLFQWGFGALVLRRRLFRLFFECLQVGEDALRFLYGSADGLKELRIQFLRSAVQYQGDDLPPGFAFQSGAAGHDSHGQTVVDLPDTETQVSAGCNHSVDSLKKHSGKILSVIHSFR